MAENLWMMGIMGSGLIAAILAARWVLERRKHPCLWSYCLWMLAGMRLLCPVFIETSLSIYPDFRKVWVQAGSDGLLILRPLYGAGICVTAGVFAVQYIRLKRCVRTAVRKEAGSRCRGGVWLSERISSPFVMGIIRPRIYLPYGLSKEEEEWALLHEQMHIRHMDPLIRLLGMIAVCLHWWNPLVWYAFWNMCQDMEMTCDESVLKDTSSEAKKRYAGALLSAAMRQSGLASGLCFGTSNTEQRVRNLFLEKNDSFLAYFLLMLFVSLCTRLFVTVF